MDSKGNTFYKNSYESCLDSRSTNLVFLVNKKAYDKRVNINCIVMALDLAFLIHLLDQEVGHLSFLVCFHSELCYYQCQYIGMLLLTYF